MHILFVVPGWPKDSFWDVLYFKFPPLSIATLAGLTPPQHTLSYVDESITPVDYTCKPDLVAVQLGHAKGDDEGYPAFARALALLMEAVPQVREPWQPSSGNTR